MRVRYHVCVPPQAIQAVCRLHYPVQPIMELLNMGRALLNSNTLAITPRCESGYSSTLHPINCFHSIPILLRMEEKGRPEYTPTIRAIVRMLEGGSASQGSGNSQDAQIETSILAALLSLREKPTSTTSFPLAMIPIRRSPIYPSYTALYPC